MNKVSKITHEFVEHIPQNLSEGVVYISIPFNTVVHKCLCGCGNEVITPLSPTDWKLNYNGDSISLYPSIGNWSFDCQSHYWITDNEVNWSRQWSDEEIEEGRKYDKMIKQSHFDRKNEKYAKSIEGNFVRKIINWFR